MRRTPLVLPGYSPVLIGLAGSVPWADETPSPVELLIITGDHGHDEQGHDPSVPGVPAPGRPDPLPVTAARDLANENLAKYDALLLIHVPADAVRYPSAGNY